MEGGRNKSSPPRVKVRARDIDYMIGHLFVDGTASITELRKSIETQMERIEIELTSALVDTFTAINDFKLISSSQLPAKYTLDSLEEILSALKPNLLLIMDRRSIGNFIC